MINEKISEPTEKRGNVELWYCTGCRSVHMGIDGARVSFDRTRFEDFAKMVADVHYESMVMRNVADLLDISNEIDLSVHSKYGN